MDFPNLNNWTSAFPFWLGGIFSLSFKFYKKILYANSGDPDLTPRSAASDQGLLYLLMSYKMDAKLIHAWVK